MPNYVAILEDNRERGVLMERCLKELLPACEVVFFDDAWAMIEWFNDHISEVIMMSLDHDLGSAQQVGDRCIDPGCGRDVADYLCSASPICPVIVHSSNDVAAAGMVKVMKKAGWPMYRIWPLNGDAWIDLEWKAEIKQLISSGWIFV